MKKMMMLLATVLVGTMLVMPVAATEEDVLLSAEEDVLLSTGEDVLLISTEDATSSEPKDRVVDDADLLTEAEEDELEGQFAYFSDLHQFELVVVTVDSTDGKTSQEFADDYFDYGGYGYGATYDGALLLVNMELSEWYVSTCGSGIDIISDAQLDAMSYEFVPYMSDGDFYSAFSEFAAQCDYLLAGCGMPDSSEDGYYEEDYYDEDGLLHSDTVGSTVVITRSPDIIGIIGKLVVCLIIGLVAAFIPMSRLKKQMKTVAMKAAAADYVKPDSRKITKSRDAFLYSNVSRRPKPKDDGPKGGGGGMSFGGGVHVGSSGRSHGGGGGRF